MEADQNNIAHIFSKYAQAIKFRQDKFERIFKIRRDIVIESKRIIFLLLSIQGDSNKEMILADAEKKIKALVDVNYKKIAEELKNEDPYQYRKAVSPGNEEFIEALTLFEFIRHGTIHGLKSCLDLPFLPEQDYILGLADLTGEIMRDSIIKAAKGNQDEVLLSAKFLRQMYTVMIGMPTFPYLPAKLEVMKASVLKVEQILYKKRIAGNKPNLLPYADQDEGYHD